MESSICHFTHSLAGSPSGYYTEGCTDPSFSDPVCLQQCSKLFGRYTIRYIFTDSRTQVTVQARISSTVAKQSSGLAVVGTLDRIAWTAVILPIRPSRRLVQGIFGV
jgi:hypothetical protein